MNYWIFLFILLSSVAFYNPLNVVSEQMQKLLIYVSVFLGLVYTIVFPQKSKNPVKFPLIAYIFLLFGICLSVVIASEFHEQSYKVSIITTLAYFLPYLSFLVFIRLKVSHTKIIRTLIVLSFVSSAVFAINMATAPNFAFGRPLEDINLERGVIRIAIVLIELFPLLLFYAINQWFETKNKRWLFYAAFLMVIIFLSVIRQLILLSAVLGMFFLLRKVSTAKKIAVIAFVLVCGVCVLPRIPVYKALLELTQDQKDENEEDSNIRIKAWQYYTVEGQTIPPLSPILGNGVPSFGNSLWGIKFEQETDDNKCFAVDVGWAGFFFYFGFVPTIALLWLLVAAAIRKKGSSNSYITYWLVYIILTSVASGPILFYYQIVSVCLGLYLAYSANPTNENQLPIEQHVNTRKKFIGYPQLTR